MKEGIEVDAVCRFLPSQATLWVCDSVPGCEAGSEVGHEPEQGLCSEGRDCPAAQEPLSVAHRGAEGRND